MVSLNSILNIDTTYMSCWRFAGGQRQGTRLLRRSSRDGLTSEIVSIDASISDLHTLARHCGLDTTSVDPERCVQSRQGTHHATSIVNREKISGSKSSRQPASFRFSDRSRFAISTIRSALLAVCGPQGSSAEQSVLSALYS